jgi:hypothetical protein
MAAAPLTHPRIVDPPPGFFLGQQVTIVVSTLVLINRAFRAGHAHIVALGSVSFKAEHTVTRLVSEHRYDDKDVSWLPGWVDDTEALVATRTLVGSFEP